MSKSEQLQAEYRQLAKSIAGRDLLNWLESTANDYRRRGADRDSSWDFNRKAEGLEEVRQRVISKAKLDTKEVKKL